MRSHPSLLIFSSLFTVIACSPVTQEPAKQQATVLPEKSVEEADIQLEAHAHQVFIAQDAVKTLTEPKKQSDAERAKMPSLLPAQMNGLSVMAGNIRKATVRLDTENYHHFVENGIKLVNEYPVSTFSIDVDTGSYTNVRRMINNGQLPRKDAVRVEEFLNYFDYKENGNATESLFNVHTEIGPTPWNQQTHLMRVSLNSKPLINEQMQSNNLVFLVDVSGSMRSANKLGLLKKSLKLLTRQLDDKDRVSIVVYAGASGVVLQPEPGNNWLKIEQAIDQLEAGGSTNGASGIHLAYQMAQQSFIKDGNNRVILATDGDFNVGTVNHEALVDLIEARRQEGVYLTALGFGEGNYNDHLMEQLADHGNGNYAYIDNLLEAKKVLVDEIGSTLQTIARDVKLQIEFNPQQVKEYRLIGYENRALAREDFNNDSVDAGEVGAGHSVMALYEISLASGDGGSIDPLRYQHQNQLRDKKMVNDFSEELAFVKLRYKPMQSDKSLLDTFAVETAAIKNSVKKNSTNYQFAAAVAAYAQKLKGGKFLNQYSYDEIYKLAAGSKGEDSRGVRSNFLQMIDLTRTLSAKETEKRISSL